MRSVKEKDGEVVTVIHPAKRICNAFGCPEVGSISHSNAGPAPAESWLCRWHFGESVDQWSEITRRRRIARNEPVEPDLERPQVNVAQVRDDLAKFAKSFGKIEDGKAWARKLRARDDAGEPLSDLQRRSWMAALPESAL